MEKGNNYFKGLFDAVGTLCTGLKVTFKEFFTPKITEQYPENRKELKMFDRFRGRLTMPHNEKNEHKCVGCGLCMMACPNGSIKVETEMYETPDGKKRRRLAHYHYNLGSCMFCMLCVRVCPHDAIRFDQEFENAVFDRSKLLLTLNHPGSHVEEKPAPARPAAAKPAAAKPVAAPAASADAAKPTAQPAAPSTKPQEPATPAGAETK